jgi:hypothetical protein
MTRQVYGPSINFDKYRKYERSRSGSALKVGEFVQEAGVMSCKRYLCDELKR